MGILKYKKPNGTEIEINDEPGNIKAAEAAGLKPVKEKKPDANKTGASATLPMENKKE